MIQTLNKENSNILDRDPSDLRERIFNNFIIDIAEFLNKKEKLCLRGISINFNERILCSLPINFNLKRK